MQKPKEGWNKAADEVKDIFKTVDESEIVQVIMSAIERYSIDVHGTAESRMLPILYDLEKSVRGRIMSV